jgi:hypothetical protein
MGGVRVGMRGDLGLGERDLVAIPTPAGGKLSQLLGAHHPLVDLGVGHLVLRVEMDPGHVRVGTELTLDRLTACLAG